jgi:hypothetical protein
MVGILQLNGWESSALGGSWFREGRSLSGNEEPASSQGATLGSGVTIPSSRQSRARSSLKIGEGKDASSVSTPQSLPSRAFFLREGGTQLTTTGAVS